MTKQNGQQNPCAYILYRHFEGAEELNDRVNREGPLDEPLIRQILK